MTTTKGGGFLSLIKKQVLEIKKLELENRKIIQDLEKEAQTVKDNGIKKIIDDFLKDNPDGEKKTAFEKSLKKLIQFTEKGGEVDCFLPSPEEYELPDGTEGKIASISENFQKIRKIETTLKRIEYYE